MNQLFEIAGEEFYFDLDKISDYIRIEPDQSIDDLLKETDLEGDDKVNGDMGGYPMGTQVIDVTKWEVVRALIETTLNETGIVDEGMGITKLGEQLSIPFRMSFNTLIKNKLIRRNG
jgi:hypothetical protein